MATEGMNTGLSRQSVRPKKKRFSSVLIVLAFGLFFLAAGFFGTVNYLLASDKGIVEGILIGGVDFGGLNKEEAFAKLDQIENELVQQNITIALGDKNWTIRVSDLKLKVNKEGTFAEAYRLGREGSVLNRYQSRKTIIDNPVSLPVNVLLDYSTFEEQVRKLAGEVERMPQDASYEIKGDIVEVVPGVTGIQIDYKQLYKQVVDGLQHGGVLHFTLPVKEVQPERTTEAIGAMKLNGLVAQYSTTFDASKVNRVKNIEIAASRIDGTLIPPGEEFSFNETVGKRTKEAGFLEAPEIVNDKLVPGVGGGVCQVSTTLFNSILLADLEITQRQNHSLAVGYVPLGRDATVTDWGLDFKFRNNTDGYILIGANVKGNRLTFRVYGNTENKKDVEFVTVKKTEIPFKVITKHDNTLPRGEEKVEQEGKVGYQVTVEKIVKKDGEVLRREVASQSNYRPVNKIVIVGTKPQTAEPQSNEGKSAEVPQEAEAQDQ